MKFYSLFLIGLLAACEEPPPSHRFTVSGTVEFAQRFGRATREWNDVCGLDLIVATYADAKGTYVFEVDNFGPRTMGRTSGPDEMKMIRIRHLDDEEFQVSVMAHEIGHSLGIDYHLPSGLMAEDWIDPVPRYVTPDLCNLVR